MSPDAQRVLQALQGAASRSTTKQLPLRRIATDALGGDTQHAARTLGELDAEGYLKTEVMGWHAGWLTGKPAQPK